MVGNDGFFELSDVHVVGKHDPNSCEQKQTPERKKYKNSKRAFFLIIYVNY